MKCPGQDMIYWKENAIYDVDCPKCGSPVEFYKDDTNRKCTSCGHRFVNPKMDFGCASYCQFAEQCLGTLPEEFKGIQDNFLKDKIAVEMKRYFKTDFKSIRLATNTARNAEEIGKSEGGNLPVILCTAYLYGAGSEAARPILKKVDANETIQQDILQIIDSKDSVSGASTLESQIIHDAVKLMLAQEQLKDESATKENIHQSLIDILFTAKAKDIATSLFQ